MILEFSDGQRQREEHKGNRGEGDMGILKKEEAARAASVPFQKDCAQDKRECTQIA